MDFEDTAIDLLHSGLFVLPPREVKIKRREI